MLRYLVLLSIIPMLIANVSIAQISSTEYFIDSDPGFGNAIQVKSQISGETLEFTVPVSGLSPGLHTLYVRSKGILTSWSLTAHHIFAVAEVPASITYVEYFFDDDPGQGKASRVATAFQGEDLAFNAPTTELIDGGHILFIRARDNMGTWSMLARHSFYLQRIGSQVMFLEYFLDIDPGNGRATKLNIASAADQTEFIVPLDGISDGFHRLGVRVRDNRGTWSKTSNHVLFVTSTDPNPKIESIQYYFADGATRYPTLTHQVANPGAIIEEEFTMDLSGLPGNKEYTLSYWALASDGTRSPLYSKQVKVCEDLPASSGFDFIRMGADVSFMDSSANSATYNWDFGDKKTASISNPVHHYAAPGKYLVRQIVSNFCNSDTTIKEINVVGIQSCFPLAGGNAGSVQLSILGAAFTTGMPVKLSRNGVEIPGTVPVANGDGRELYATFELYDKEPGSWDLVVGSGANQTILEDAFKIEPAKMPEISVDIEGRDMVRTGRATKYTIHVNNSGNVDAKGVPVFFAVPTGSKVDMDFYVIVPSNTGIDYDTMSLFVTIDSLFERPGTKMDVYGFLLRNVPARGSKSLSFNLTLAGTGSVLAWAMPPFYGSPLKDAVIDCTLGIIDIIGEFNPGVACLKSTFDVFYDQYIFLTGEEEGSLSQAYRQHPGANGAPLDITGVAVITKDITTPLFNVFYAAGTSCVDALTGKFFKWENAAMVLAKNVYNAVGRMRKPRSLKITVKDRRTVYETGDFILDVFETGLKCWGVFELSGLKDKLVITAASYDPNEKVGPRGKTDANHIQGKSAFNYRIYFENLKSATAPAQEVVVIDTIDMEKFSANTFQLRAFGFGGSEYQVPNGLHEFFQDVDLRPSQNMLVRVNAKFDTVSGVLKWSFLAIDPATKELIDDPLDGFLPPNNASPEGEGFIAFVISPKPSLPSGMKIENKGTIFFDTNAPIVTNTFINTIDLVDPSSSVKSATFDYENNTVNLSWAGEDLGAGVRSYDVYYAVNDGAFRLWKFDAIVTSAAFSAKPDSTYHFYSIAKDHAGNEEAGKTSADQSVSFVTGIEPVTAQKIVSIYPNPANDIATLIIQVREPWNITVKIRDLQGREIAMPLRTKFHLEGQHHIKFEIETGDLAPGIYICEIKAGDLMNFIKFVKR